MMYFFNVNKVTLFHHDSGGLPVVAGKKSNIHSEKKKSEGADKKAASKSQTNPETLTVASLYTTQDLVTIDRRKNQDRRSGIDRRTQNLSVSVERRVGERRAKVNRRRQIDPTTCERDYTSDEIEFMNALDNYKRHSGRMFPTCSEILEVLKSLGYEKQPQTPAIAPGPTPAQEIAGLPNMNTEGVVSATNTPVPSL